MPSTTKHVWVVNRYNEVDGIYVFVHEDQAQIFADRYDDAVLSEEPVMDRTLAAELLLADEEES